MEGGLPVGAAGDSHITDIGGAQRARGDREDMDVDPIPPSSVSTSGSNRQLSPIRSRRGTASSSSDMVELMKLQMVTDTAERKSKQEQMKMDREDRIEERRVAM